MTERAPQSPPTDWDLTAIGEVLPGPVEPRPDPVLGNGLSLHLGAQPGTEVDLFPAAGVVRIATSDVHIALVRQHPPTIEPSGIVFARTSEHGVSRLTVAPDGAVALTLSPTPDHHDLVSAPVSPVDAADSTERPIRRVTASQPVEGPPGPSDDPSGERSEDAGNEQDGKQRVQLQGRLGAAPRFRTTVNDTLIARFPLAVHHDDDTTTWHTVVAFGEKAAQLQSAAFTKGEPIAVIGYEHERTYTKNDGTENTEIQIYAAVVRRR